MSTDNPVLTRTVGTTRILTLSRPEILNAWDVVMANALCKALEEADADPSVHCAMIMGAGDRAFSSGANLRAPNAHSTPSVEDFISTLDVNGLPHRFRRILAFKKPLISAVNGYAIGAGFLLTLCTDIIIATETADFRLPQTRLGVLPAFGGTLRLAQWVGRGRAMEIALTGRSVLAEEAHRIGLVSQIVPLADLEATGLSIAEHLAEMPLSASVTKQSLLFGLETGPLEQTSLIDLYRFMTLTLTERTKDKHAEWRRALS